jgi:hypothetical protein
MPVDHCQHGHPTGSGAPCPKCQDIIKRFRATVEKKDAERGRPLTDRERLENLEDALSDVTSF